MTYSPDMTKAEYYNANGHGVEEEPDDERIEAKLKELLLEHIASVGTLADDNRLSAETWDRIAFAAITRLLQTTSGCSLRLVVGKQGLEIGAGALSTNLQPTSLRATNLRGVITNPATYPVAGKAL